MTNFLKWLDRGFVHFMFGCLVGVFYMAIMVGRVEAQEPYFHSCEYKEKQSYHSALACNIYFEARGSIKADKMGVGFTSLNRLKAERFKGTLVDIIYKPYAFSWTNDGKSDRVYDLKAWVNSLYIASWLLSITPEQYELLDITEGSLFYHRYNISPYWTSQKFLRGRIGSHIYYWNDKKA